MSNVAKSWVMQDIGNHRTSKEASLSEAYSKCNRDPQALEQSSDAMSGNRSHRCIPSIMISPSKEKVFEGSGLTRDRLECIPS